MRRFIELFKSVRHLKLLIAFAWLVGLVAGALVAVQSTALHNFIIKLFSNSRLSTFGFLTGLIVPFLATFLFYKLSLYSLAIPFVFAKAFSYSWCACAIQIAFADAGWLMRCLFVFSDSILVVALLWFCFYGLCRDNNQRLVGLLSCLVIVLAIGCIDCCFISSFGISLLSYF